jgi:putative hydrolase of the HAD superfamily
VTTLAPASGRAVFFDLYGTLLDIRTNEDDPWVYATLAQYLTYVGVSISPEALQQEYRIRVRAYLEGSGEPHPEVDIYTVFRDLLTAHREVREREDFEAPSGTRHPDEEACQVLSTAVLFRSLTRRQFAVFPQVHEVLDRLRNRYRLGLISDAQWVFTDPELEMTGLTPFFPVRILSSRVGVRKPDPRMFVKAMRELGVSPENSVYVGDTPPRDLVGARNAGMKCILFKSANVVYNGLRPDACFQTFAELEALIDDQFPREA